MSQVYWQPGMSLRDVEKLVIQAALQYTSGHRENAAEALGISLRTIQTKIQVYELTVATGETKDTVILPRSIQPALAQTMRVNVGKTNCAIKEISTEVLLDIEEQVKLNHANKTFYQLSQEGGLTPLEIYAAFHKMTAAKAKIKGVSPQRAADWLVERYGIKES